MYLDPHPIWNANSVIVFSYINIFIHTIVRFVIKRGCRFAVGQIYHSDIRYCFLISQV